MRGRRPLSRSLAAATIVVSLAACGGHGVSPDSGTDSSIDLSSSPRTELPTTESPQQTANNGVAISLPSLPVGGTAISPDGIKQCATLSWSGPEIPDGVKVEVRSIVVQPATTYSPSDAGCAPDGSPKCTGFVFTRETTGPCDAGLMSTSPPPGAAPQATLFLSGRCSGATGCATLRQDIQQSPAQGIPLPGEVVTPPSSSSPTDSSPGSGASTTGG